jgi:hypothetical protein
VETGLAWIALGVPGAVVAERWVYLVRMAAEVKVVAAVAQTMEVGRMAERHGTDSLVAADAGECASAPQLHEAIPGAPSRAALHSWRAHGA